MSPSARHPLAWLIIASGTLVAGWLVFDGLHAFLAGDYVMPDSGEYAGQLGPWSHLVDAVGVPPRSTAMKVIHVGFGGAWLAVLALFARRRRGSWRWALGFAFGVLWYLPVGTLVGVVQIILLFVPPVRSGESQPRPSSRGDLP